MNTELKITEVKEGTNIAIANLTTEGLIEILCKCGKKLIITGKGWNIDFCGDVKFTCPCGNITVIGPSLN